MKNSNTKIEGKNLKLSVVIIAKNEEEKIADCIDSVDWADEIILIDSGSDDKTKEIAKNMGVQVFDVAGGSYDKWRNECIKYAKADWIFYIDADERVDEKLKKEIISRISDENSPFNAYAIPRRNFILGREMKHGGWWPDYVKRLFRMSALKKWTGELHEEPVFDGNMCYLTNPLIHIKHKYLSEMVEKTNKWSRIEAEMLYQSNHPKMTWWRFFRIMVTELWYRLIIKKGFMDGVEGVIYSIYQMWSRFITYAKLWEMQIRKSDDGF